MSVRRRMGRARRNQDVVASTTRSYDLDRTHRPPSPLPRKRGTEGGFDRIAKTGEKRMELSGLPSLGSEGGRPVSPNSCERHFFRAKSRKKRRRFASRNSQNASPILHQMNSICRGCWILPEELWPLSPGLTGGRLGSESETSGRRCES